ncbi:MAG TPA: DNA cytosine methyltransferase, partial [Synergistaceae bacterium]|nr:DNA cytosine methyltransferase [Synergistaceae bacterium]
MPASQAFPDDYVFVPAGGKFQFRTLGRQIGNAVPVSLARKVASSISGRLVEDRYGFRIIGKVVFSSL